MQDFYSFFSDVNTLLKVSFIFMTSVIMLFLAEKFSYRFGFVDKPNSRSNHNKPIALGAGIVIIPLIVISAIINNYIWDKTILISLLILFLISVLDDIKNIRPLPRLFFHFLAITIFVYFYINPKIYYLFYDNDYLYLLSSLFLIIGLSWFINAFNFMDGINGITAVEVISLCLSLMLISFYLNKEVNVLALSVLIIVSTFCYFNWTPASIFLGDSGSIPLGFISIYLLTDLALTGMWLAAVILPLYYLMDTSIILIKRIFQKKRFWEAHSEHYYQQAIKNGYSHSSVSIRLLIINMGLFMLSFFTVMYKNEVIFFIIGMVWCTLFMYLFSNKTK